jgi:hypothetical protein
MKTRTIAMIGLGLLAGCSSGGGGSGSGGGSSGESLPTTTLSAHEVAQSRAEIAKRATLRNTDHSAVVASNGTGSTAQGADNSAVVLAEDAQNYYVNASGDFGGVALDGGIGVAKGEMRRVGSFLTKDYTVGGDSYQLTMLAPEGAAELAYVDVGAGLFFDDATKTTGLVSFAGGDATPVGNVPASGSATYTGTAGAYYATNTGTFEGVSGGMSMNVDFAKKTTSLQLEAMRSLTPGSSLVVPGFVGEGEIKGNGFSGTLVQAGGSFFTGAYNGRFYGPKADEIGGSFSAGSSTEGLVGAFAGKK